MLAIDKAPVLSVRLVNFSLNSKILRLLGKFKTYLGDKSVRAFTYGEVETEGKAGLVSHY